MKVEFSLTKQITPNATRARIGECMDDVETVLNLFPKLRSITVQGDEYFWELQPIGAAGVEREVSYGTTISANHDTGRIDITPVAGYGNASVGGYLQIGGSDDAPTVEVSLGGSVDVDIPFLVRGPAKPFIREVFVKLVERFAERLQDHVEA